jgi:hypothetical protein
MDIPHNFTAGFVYELPFGRGKPIAANSWLDNIVGGWSFGGVLTYQSGLPIPSPHPASSHVPLFAGGIRPNRVEGEPLLTTAAESGDFDPLADTYLNAAAWASPAPFSFGNASGMSGARVPAMLNEDFMLSKSIPIRESLKLQFRAEAFNAFNRTVFGFPDLDLGSSGFGRIASQRNSPRTMQMGLRLSF